MPYNPHIHHRRSIRLKGYDYSQEGVYFITICCADRKCLFGKITDGKMVLNEYGIIAYNEWINTSALRPNIELDVFVVMPNHIHGIIIIRRGVLHTPHDDAHTPDDDAHAPDGKGVLHTPDNPDISKRGEFNSPLPPRSPSQTIGAIVRGYKSSVTKKINEIKIRKGVLPAPPSVWQRNYYEHIIRNPQSYQTISQYIINNPAKWNEDKFFSE